MIKRLLKFITIIVIFSFTTIFLLVGISATETGSRWLINWLVKTNDIPVTIETIEGSLLTNVNFIDLHYQDRKGNEVTLDRFELDWSASELLGFEVRVNKLFLSGLEYQSRSGKSSGIKIPELKIPSLPVAVYVNEINIQNANIVVNTIKRNISRVKSSLRIDESGLLFKIDELLSKQQHFSGSVALTKNGKTKINASVTWSGELENEPGRGELMITGQQDDLSVVLNVDSVLDIRAKGNVNLVKSPYAVKLNGEVNGEIFRDYMENIAFDSPVTFRLTGDINQMTGNFDSSAHTASGESFNIKVETDAAIPGDIYDRLTVNFNWEIIPDNADNFYLSLMGQGDFEYAEQVITIDHDLKLPVAINLKGETDLSKKSIDMTMTWENITLPVSDSKSLRMENGIIKATGELDEILFSLQTRYLISSDLAAESRQPATFEEMFVEGKFNLLEEHPVGQLSGVLTTPVPDLFKDYSKELDAISFSVQSKDQFVDLSVETSVLAKNDRHYDLVFTGSLDLASDDAARQLLFNWSVKPGTEQDSNFQVSGNGKFVYMDDHVLIKHESKAPFETRLEGDVYLSDTEETRLSLNLSWQDISLPVEKTRSLLGQEGSIHLEGPWSYLTVNADGNFQFEPVGMFDINMVAFLSDSLLTIERIKAEVLEGRININGSVNMQERTEGKLRLEGRGLNFGKINPDLISRLNVSSVIDFSDVAGVVSTQVNVSSISGEWRGFPVSGLAELDYAEDILRINQLHLESGNNSIDLNLNLNQLLSGVVDLNIQDLSVFSSDLAGEIQGRMELGGYTDAASIQGKITGKNIYIKDLRLASLIADTNIDLRPHQKSSLTLQLGPLAYKDYLLDEVSITGMGLTELHTISIIARGEELSLVGKLNGGLRDKVWSGQLNQFDINSEDFGLWQLNKSATMEWKLAENALKLEQSCLYQDDSQVCIAPSFLSASTISADVQLDRIPLRYAEFWLPENLSLNGYISGNFLYKTVDDQWELQTNIEGTGTQVGVGYEENIELLDIESASFKASVNNQSREIAVRFISRDYFNLVFNGFMKNQGDQPLQADLDLSINDIVWLENLEPSLTGSHGKIQAHLMAGGTIYQPEIDGEFSLKDGLLSILPLGLNIEQVKGNIQSDDASHQIQLSSSLTSGEKQLTIKGYTSLIAEKGYPYTFDVTGENFPAVRTADITMDISPELNISGTRELHYIRGRVTVPLLDMLLTSLPENAVTVSPDVVIIQSKQPGAVHVSNGNGSNDFIKNHLDIDIDVFLEPDIHIQGFGMDMSLTGDVNIIKPVGIYQPRGEGLVSIKEGSYRAYGQNLEIEQGRLQFAGPLDNPGINVRAYRPNLPVKAGVSISGNIRQPRLTLFSEPPQSETDTLSYLITGRPISGASGGEANLIAQAALTLGAKESSVLTSQIESMFNLDEFSVGSGDTIASTTLNASKHLSRNLTFRSSFNPFDQLWSFFLNYNLSDHWSVQTESGVSQGADIIYSVKSNTFKDLGTQILDFLKF